MSEQSGRIDNHCDFEGGHSFGPDELRPTYITRSRHDAVDPAEQTQVTTEVTDGAVIETHDVPQFIARRVAVPSRILGRPVEF